MLNKMFFSSPVLTTKQVGNYLFIALDTISPSATVTMQGGSPIIVGPFFAIDLATGLPVANFSTTNINGRIFNINSTTSGKLVLVGNFTIISINGVTNPSAVNNAGGNTTSCIGFVVIDISNLPIITFDTIQWNAGSLPKQPPGWTFTKKSEVYNTGLGHDQIFVCGRWGTAAGGLAQFIQSGNTWTRRPISISPSVVDSIEVTSNTNLTLNNIALDQTNGVLYTTYGSNQVVGWNTIGNGTALLINPLATSVSDANVPTAPIGFTRKQFYLPYNYATSVNLNIWYNNSKLYVSGKGLYGATPSVSGFSSRKGLSIFTTCANAGCAPTQDSLNLDLGVWSNIGDPNTSTYLNDLKFSGTKMYLAGVINTPILKSTIDSYPIAGVHTKYNSRYYWTTNNGWSSQTCCPQPWNCFECNFGTTCSANSEGPTTPLVTTDTRTYSTSRNDDIFLCLDGSGNPLSSFLNSMLISATAVNLESGASGYVCNPNGYNGSEKQTYTHTVYRDYYTQTTYGIKQGKGNSIFLDSNGNTNVFGDFITGQTCGGVDGFNVGNHLIFDSNGQKFSSTAI